MKKARYIYNLILLLVLLVFGTRAFLQMQDKLGGYKAVTWILIGIIWSSLAIFIWMGYKALKNKQAATK